jgi:hypothetical protein
VQVTKAFTQTLNGERAKIGDIELQLDEEVIARATKLSLKLECWSEILVSPECKYDYKGMPISSIEEKMTFFVNSY